MSVGGQCLARWEQIDSGGSGSRSVSSMCRASWIHQAAPEPELRRQLADQRQRGCGRPFNSRGEVCAPPSSVDSSAAVPGE